MFQEEAHWKQRSRKQWLQVGDLNIAYFHQCAKARYTRNRINKLVDEGGLVRTSEEDISNCILDFYSELFSSSSLTWDSIDQALRFVENRVDEEMNNLLDAAFTEEEI